MAGAETPEAALRVDKWLWRARFFKARSGAAKSAEAGFRLNGERSQKAHQLVRPGDVLTFRQAGDVRVVRVLALGERRGPAPEAALLYEDLEAGAEG
ncbi:MAG: RNA-binding S4 domain-containing protein [Pikeienuella sp.]|uniref:RNA-binding S4 domain-containing protein n=1 Tax=Pikeienuella sp. TaxID=2831957 RepID=UPI00391C6DB8